MWLPFSSRGGRAIRLSYDHKASDPYEQQRITEAGGLIMNDRVNGIFSLLFFLFFFPAKPKLPLFFSLGTLAITRAIGDVALKQIVVSHPYTTETTITHDDSFLILACDGVILHFFLFSFFSAHICFDLLNGFFYL